MKPLHFALVGEDLSYSRSPDIFKAIFDQLGREGQFDLSPTSPEHLQTAVKNLIADGVTGFSVTIPHKQAIIQYLGSADDLVHTVGVANSVAVREGSLHGHNTDCYGVTFALRKAGFDGCERALILGAGGAARAVANALVVDFGIRDFVLCGRSVEKLSNFKYFLSNYLYSIVVQIITEQSFTARYSSESLLVVNCTPLGGPLFSDVSPIPPGLDWCAVKLFFDLNYNADNQTIKVAREAGVDAIDGSTMLVAQALRSLELWSGMSVGYELVYEQAFPHRGAPKNGHK